MVKNRRANAVLFGFDFQRNAAIILMLERIKELRSVRLEGNEEDIELTLENGKKILAQRIALVNSFDWKAHHRETNNLLGIFWDFLNEVPTIVACFYRNDLVIDDWGRIVQPTDGGGRTTSVSIMAKTGIKKMCDGWIAVIDRPEYIDAFSRSKWIGYSVK